MTMVEHLEELRRRLMIVIAAIAIAAVLGFVVSGPVLDLLRQPLPEEYSTLYFNSPAGAFVAQLKIAGFIGVALAMPVILYRGLAVRDAGAHARRAAAGLAVPPGRHPALRARRRRSAS